MVQIRQCRITNWSTTSRLSKNRDVCGTILVLRGQDPKSKPKGLEMLPKIFDFSPLFLLVVPLLLLGCGPDTTLLEPEDAKVAGTVDLEIDFQSEKKKIQVAVPCSADSTVFSILTRAQNLGDLKFESRGSSPESRFVTSIGGVENQAAAGDNWVFRVNGELADRGCGEISVRPGDQVQWMFGEYP